MCLSYMKSKKLRSFEVVSSFDGVKRRISVLSKRKCEELEPTELFLSGISLCLAVLLFYDLRVENIAVNEVSIVASATINPKEISGDEPISSEGLINFKIIIITKPKIKEEIIYELIKNEITKCPLTRVLITEPQIIYIT